MSSGSEPIRPPVTNLAVCPRTANVPSMRQRCELCEALGAVSPSSHKLIGVAVGPRDALLCADHALFALDSDVADLDELREVYEFVGSDDAAPAERGRRGGSRAVHAGRGIL